MKKLAIMVIGAWCCSAPIFAAEEGMIVFFYCSEMRDAAPIPPAVVCSLSLVTSASNTLRAFKDQDTHTKEEILTFVRQHSWLNHWLLKELRDNYLARTAQATVVGAKCNTLAVSDPNAAFNAAWWAWYTVALNSVDLAIESPNLCSAKRAAKFATQTIKLDDSNDSNDDPRNLARCLSWNIGKEAIARCKVEREARKNSWNEIQPSLTVFDHLFYGDDVKVRSQISCFFSELYGLFWCITHGGNYYDQAFNSVYEEMSCRACPQIGSVIPHVFGHLNRHDLEKSNPIIQGTKCFLNRLVIICSPPSKVTDVTEVTDDAPVDAPTEAF